MGMPSVRTVVGCGILLVAAATRSWAANTVTAGATVLATVPSIATMTLQRDPNSVTRFSAGEVVFDRLDSQDPGVTNPDPNLMYAPYRSEVGKNWHVVRIQSTDPTLSLTASVTGTVGSTPLASIMNVFSGGFFATGASSPLSGTASTTWETLNGFKRPVNQTFDGIVPMSYQLNVAGISAGTYNGNVTYTLTTQ